uniref:Phosphate acyltransferase n=1 Tax=Candidatus Kentrum sp. TC TaxID=2126339 RepID=A0A450ZL24_9GAMM|nr:MAG: phosphate:acyl-[acyl carrier protein] acyltransferase [Candidatus Kentron sp. TC]VFK54450.1 MAG: glycerol-3-phosphate acyltransferase PlsX [Candidatus Kentron sp. TC]
MNLTIALDAMGGDYGPSVIVPAAIRILAEERSVRLILVGDEGLLGETLGAHGARLGEHLAIYHASQRVEMDEVVSLALRNKKDSSMRVAINLVKEGVADACVSAGNTGALMAMARFVLKTLSGVDRPAICTSLPSLTGHAHLLDLGANIDSTPTHLFQFGIMGSVLACAVDNNPRPKVGLLNVGEEEIKGNENVKEAGRLLSSANIDYIGFVEGDDIYKGVADVIVCDGFVGNVALKASEGVAKMIIHFIKQEFKGGVLSRIAGVASKSVLSRLGERVDPRRYNGASLLGLRGIVIKSHGGADVFSFTNAIKQAMAECRKNVPSLISEQLESMLKDGAN